ncbi:MAG: YdbL family protein [Rickettsiales bacterium]
MKSFLTIFTITLFAALPAFALDLATARMSGQLGEQTDGFVAVLKNSPEVTQLAAEVNARRRAEYERISKENGQPVNVVGKLAAEQVIQKLPAGSMYQSPSGSWQKR